jgi:putative peptide zinc metalloprotease protein
VIRRLTIALVALAFVGGPALARPAEARADNSAVAINTKDGSSLFKFAFAIKRVAGDVVDEQNAAVSYASCTECQTVAIAIEIVLVTGDPSVVTPTNLAIALNDQCTLCVTVADAYQFVVSAPSGFSFSPHGMQQIRRIADEIRDLGKGDLSAAEIQSRLEQLVQELRDVLVQELANASQPNGGGNGARGPPTTTSTEPETTTAPETSTAPTVSTTETTTTTTSSDTGVTQTTTDTSSTTTTP